MEEQTVVHLDREQVRVLAHPLRARLLSALRVYGPATATGLAERLGTSSGQTSYHLRMLDGVGLVVEDVERGNARDRWWRAAHDATSWTPADLAGDPDTRAAEDWLLGHGARTYAARLAHWLADRGTWSSEWVAAAGIADLRMRLSPARLAQLNDDLLAVIQRYRAEQSSPDDADAVDCTVIVTSFPDPSPTL